jgi:hypothetical protein
MVRSVSENQFNSLVMKIYEEELIYQKWNTFSENEKKFVINFTRLTKPNVKDAILEAKWYNTVGDVVGVFDPSGAVDAVNAVSYFRQGDILFGIFSLISAFPYLGDMIAKPIMGVLKGGGATAKFMKLATSPAKWRFLGMKFPALKLLFTNIAKIGPWVIKNLEKVGAAGFVDIVSKWLGPEGIFTKAAKEGVKSGKLNIKTPKSFDVRIFRDFGMKKEWGTFTKLWKKGGFFKNRQLSNMLKNTKFYLGFLGFVGLDEYVEPEELEELMGEDQINDKMNDYLETSDAKENWETEVGELDDEEEISDKNKEDKPFKFEVGEDRRDPFVKFIFD